MAIRETDVLCGHIRGIAAGNPAVTAFKGIPYAEAPTGNNRWRPPIPKKPLSGTFDAVRFGNICPQVIPQPGTFYHKEFFSYQHLETHHEDCLQLNIWTPADSKSDNLPVLVFIHGGGFQTNYSFAPQLSAWTLWISCAPRSAGRVSSWTSRKLWSSGPDIGSSLGA